MDLKEWARILGKFRKDGTHPDYPIKQPWSPEEWGLKGRHQPLFDLPALAVYEKEQGQGWAPGIIFLVGYGLEGVRVQVMSEYQGQVRLHALEESPSGKRPAYLLLKKYVPMMNAP